MELSEEQAINNMSETNMQYIDNESALGEHVVGSEQANKDRYDEITSSNENEEELKHNEEQSSESDIENI